MTKILPFNGLRYNTDIVGDLSLVTTPPYDAVSPEEQKKYYMTHPFNIIRLELGAEQPEDDDLNNNYTRSADILGEWLESGVLMQDDIPSMYIYGQKYVSDDGRERFLKGLMCLVRLEDFERGIILPHEETFSKAKNDRYNLLDATGTNFSPVYSLCNDEGKIISEIFDSYTAETPETEFKTDDGVNQILWRISDEQIILKLQKYFEDKKLLLADGHHRYEAALNFRNTMREENIYHTGDELYNYVLMFIADINDPELTVLPAHRLIRNIPDFSEDYIIRSLEENFDIEKVACNTATEIEKNLAAWADEKVFAMYTGKDYYYEIKLKNIRLAMQVNPEKSLAYQCLDVTVLHSLILNKIFGFDTEGRSNILYTQDYKEAENAVKQHEAQCAFFINPVKIHEISDVAEANEKMPPKSTYFYPKLGAGIIMNKFI